MKQRITFPMVLALAFMLPGRVSAQTPPKASSPADIGEDNLQVVIEGPFEICRDDDSQTLQIFVPKLRNSHFVPGFSTAWWELPLGQPSPDGSLAKFQVYAAGTTDYHMTSPWSDPAKNAGAMQLGPVPGTQAAQYPNPNVNLYSEPFPAGYSCSKIDTGLATVSLSVPFPDEVWPLESSGETSFITDDSTPPKPTGPCQNCRFADRVVLLYRAVDLHKLAIYTGAAPGTCPAVTANVWCPVFAMSEGTAEMTLDMKPIPPLAGDVVQQSNDAAAQAFLTVSEMANLGSLRHLQSHGPIQPRNPNHSDCHAPVMFIGAAPASDQVMNGAPAEKKD